MAGFVSRINKAYKYATDRFWQKIEDANKLQGSDTSEGYRLIAVWGMPVDFFTDYFGGLYPPLYPPQKKADSDKD